jgi:hypothetical protein
MFPARRTLLAFCLVAAALAFAKKEELQPPPTAHHARTYPALDAHADEQVAIAADPFDLGDKTGFMLVPYAANDILPVRIIVSNDSDRPLNLSGMQVVMNTVNPRAKLRPAEVDDLQRRLARQDRRGDEAPKVQVPFPMPGRKLKPQVKKEWVDEIESLRFKWLVVEPHTSAAGFLFFDVRDLDHPLAGGHIYLTGIRDDRGQELLFFDIATEKYLTYRPAASQP